MAYLGDRVFGSSRTSCARVLGFSGCMFSVCHRGLAHTPLSLPRPPSPAPSFDPKIVVADHADSGLIPSSPPL